MSYVIYLDVFFILNFFMDILILTIATSLVRPQSTRIRRIIGIITGAIVGATFACAILYMRKKMVFAQKIITYVVVPGVMCFSCYGKKIRLKNIFMLYGVTLFVSGAMELIITMISSDGIHKSIGVFLLIAVIAYSISEIGAKYIRHLWQNKNEMKELYDVMLCNKGRICMVKALYDTGNSLIEPISGEIVHVLEKECITTLIEGVEADKIKLRIVPYRSVGITNGILKAVEIDEIRIKNEGEFVSVNKPLLGMYEGKLSQKGRYQMILNRSIKKWF